VRELTHRRNGIIFDQTLGVTGSISRLVSTGFQPPAWKQNEQDVRRHGVGFSLT
jgi:hypothetical protein